MSRLSHNDIGHVTRDVELPLTYRSSACFFQLQKVTFDLVSNMATKDGRQPNMTFTMLLACHIPIESRLNHDKMLPLTFD